MTIRPATPDDVPLVLPMVAKLAALHEAWDVARYPYLPDIAKKYDRWLRSRAVDPRSIFFVAEVAPGSLAGFAVATIEATIPIYRVGDIGFVHDLWVEENYRHEGIGRQLTMMMIERFKELGVKQIRLETAAQNEGARALFASCGFRVSSIEMLLEVE